MNNTDIKGKKQRKETVYDDISIYMLESNDLENKYIGSTVNTKNRLIHHKYRSKFEKGKNYNLKLYKMIREKGGIENFTIKIIERSSFENNKEKLIRESFWINHFKPNMNSINGYYR